VKLERDAERLRAEEESKRAGGTIDLMEQGKKEMREMDREMDALREKLVAAEAGKEKEDVAEGEEKRELEREVGRMQVELEEEQTGRRIETDALKEQLQEVISSQTNSTKDLSAFQAELAALRTQLADQSAAHEAELARLASTSSSTASASQSTITTLETQVTSLTSALDQAKTDAATVSSASAQKLSSLQEELTAKGRTIAKLNKQLLVARAASGDEGAGGALKLSGLKAGAGARAGLAHSGSLRESAVRRPGLMGAGGKGGADSEEMKEIERRESSSLPFSSIFGPIRVRLTDRTSSLRTLVQLTRRSRSRRSSSLSCRNLSLVGLRSVFFSLASSCV
jgi:phage-related tail protein